jgi:hypothetical protein
MAHYRVNDEIIVLVAATVNLPQFINVYEDE